MEEKEEAEEGEEEEEGEKKKARVVVGDVVRGRPRRKRIWGFLVNKMVNYKR